MRDCELLVIPEHAMFLYGDERPAWSPCDVRDWVKNHAASQALADMLAQVWNHVGDLCHDADEGCRSSAVLEEWSGLLEELMARAARGLDVEPGSTPWAQLIAPFMAAHGYRGGSGWWISAHDDADAPASYFVEVTDFEARRNWVLSLFDGCEVVATRRAGDEWADSLEEWETEYEISSPALKKAIWFVFGEGERLTLGYNGWHTHYDWYELDMQHFESDARRLIAGDLDGLCDLNGTPLAEKEASRS